MPFQDALTSEQLETLRGTDAEPSSYGGTVYISACPNNTIYTGRVNQASFATSFAQLTYDGGSGTLADIQPNMTLLISHTNDRSKAFFKGRTRRNGAGVVATSSILYINETSAPIRDNDYIFVIDDFAIKDKLGRQVSNVQKMDYDTNFRQLLPIILGLKSAYVKYVDVDSGVYTIEFPLQALAATSGATILAWSLDFGDGTVIDGDETTPTITVEFEEGFRWIYFTVVDSGLRSVTRKVPVWAHSDAFPPQLLDSEQLQITNSVGSGWDATVTAFAGSETMLDNTLIVAWMDEENYQDGTASLTGDNIVFVGRIRKNTDTAQPEEDATVTGQRQYTLEGPMTQLARIEQLPYEMLNKASPSVFGDIKNLTLWRGIVFLLSECSTFLELHSLRFDDTSDTYLAPTRNPVGNILNAVNDLAGSVNAAMQMNAAGLAEVIRDARMLHYDKDNPDERDVLVTVATWTTSDLLEIEFEHSHARPVGRLKSTGGSYNSVSNLYADYESLAPGVAQEEGDGSAQLDRQVLRANSTAAAAKAELNERAGHAFERAQEVDQIRALFPDGYYGVLIAALDQWHTFNVDDDDIDIHLEPTDRWLLNDVSINFDTANESIEVRGTFIKETIGAPGQTVTYPASPEIPLIEPTIPPFDPYPPFPIDIIDVIGTDPVIDPIVFIDQVPKDGNAVITGTADQCLVIVNFKKTNTPGTRDVTPIDLLGTIRDGRRGKLKDFYLLSSDVDNSRVYYTEDIFAGDVIWTYGDDLPGEFTQLVTTETAGEVYVVGEEAACTTVMTAGAGSFTFATPGEDGWCLLLGEWDGSELAGVDSLVPGYESPKTANLIVTLTFDGDVTFSQLTFEDAMPDPPIFVGRNLEYRWTIYDEDDNPVYTSGIDYNGTFGFNFTPESYSLASAVGRKFVFYCQRVDIATYPWFARNFTVVTV